MRQLFFLVFSAILLFSCQQSELEKEISTTGANNQSQQKIDANGTLLFNDLEQFFTTADSIGKLQYRDFRKWENSLGFSSRFTDYKEALESSNFVITDSLSSPMVFNSMDSTYDINSVNSGIARLTDKNGLVIIGGATYLFSAKEVAYYNEVSRDALKELTSVNTKRSTKVISKPVKEMTSRHGNARVAPWEVGGKGNYVNDVVQGSNNPCWMYSRLIGRYYEVPVSPIQIKKRQSIDLLASYYHQGVGGPKLRIPQKFEASWNFEVYYAPCGICVPQYNPITGTYNESGVTSIEITLFDGDNSDVRNLSVPISASDYNTSGQTVVSSTTHLFTN